MVWLKISYFLDSTHLFKFTNLKIMPCLLSTTDVQYAFLPALWWWIFSGLGVGGLGAAVIAKITTISTEGTKLGVIGMKGAGKTTFLSHLGLVENDGGTALTPYKGKKVDVGHREIEIAAGLDIGGEDEFMGFYEPWLCGEDKKDIILFIFDGCRYLNDAEYRENAISRLQFIHEKYKQGNSDVKEYKNIVLIASHLDEYKGKDMRHEILKITGKKVFWEIFKNNFFAVDVRKRDEISDININIF